MIDPELHRARALLVEDSALLRSITTAQLHEAGVGQVVPCTRLHDARVMLERERFDIVVCNRDFEGADMSGQDLVDELRREHQLPPTTVFIMIASEATYAQVVEAAEAALDGVLVRPFNAATLVDRLIEARQRKRALSEILKALEAGEDEIAFARALKRFHDGQAYALYCGRLSAELLLGLQRPDDARKVFERIVQAKGKDWARLGVIRADWAAGRCEQAQAGLAALLEASPGFADAHDLHGHICLEQAAWDAAAAAYGRAAALTPGCLLRGQHAGSLAFYLGDANAALALLRRSRAQGLHSRLFDALSLLIMAIIHFDLGDHDGVRQRRSEVAAMRRRHPQSQRLGLMEQAAQVLVTRLENPERAGLEALPALTLACEQTEISFEMLLIVMLLWARMPPSAHRDAQMGQAAQALCMRHAGAAEGDALILSATSHHPVIEQAVRTARARTGPDGPYGPGDSSARGRPGILHVAGMGRAKRSPGSMLLRR